MKKKITISILVFIIFLTVCFIVHNVLNKPEEKTTSIDELLAKSPTKEDFIKNIEEFMGGQVTFTEEGNQWLNSIYERSD